MDLSTFHTIQNWSDRRHSVMSSKHCRLFTWWHRCTYLPRPWGGALWLPSRAAPPLPSPFSTPPVYPPWFSGWSASLTACPMQREEQMTHVSFLSSYGHQAEDETVIFFKWHFTSNYRQLIFQSPFLLSMGVYYNLVTLSLKKRTKNIPSSLILITIQFIEWAQGHVERTQMSQAIDILTS